MLYWPTLRRQGLKHSLLGNIENATLKRKGFKRGLVRNVVMARFKMWFSGQR